MMARACIIIAMAGVIVGLSPSVLAQGRSDMNNYPGAANAQAAVPASRLAAGVREYPAGVLRALIVLADEPPLVRQLADDPELLDHPDQISPPIDARVRGAIDQLRQMPAILAVAAAHPLELQALKRLYAEAPEGMEQRIQQMRVVYSQAELQAAVAWQRALESDPIAFGEYRDLLTRFCEEQRQSYAEYPCVEVVDRQYYLACVPNEAILDYLDHTDGINALRPLVQRWAGRYSPTQLDDAVLRGEVPRAPGNLERTLAAQPTEVRENMWRPAEGQAAATVGLVPVIMQPPADQPPEARYAYAVGEHARLWTVGQAVAALPEEPVISGEPPADIQEALARAQAREDAALQYAEDHSYYAYANGGSYYGGYSGGYYDNYYDSYYPYGYRTYHTYYSTIWPYYYGFPTYYPFWYDCYYPYRYSYGYDHHRGKNLYVHLGFDTDRYRDHDRWNRYGDRRYGHRYDSRYGARHPSDFNYDARNLARPIYRGTIVGGHRTVAPEDRRDMDRISEARRSTSEPLRRDARSQTDSAARRYAPLPDRSATLRRPAYTAPNNRAAPSRRLDATPQSRSEGLRGSALNRGSSNSTLRRPAIGPTRSSGTRGSTLRGPSSNTLRRPSATVRPAPTSTLRRSSATLRPAPTSTLRRSSATPPGRTSTLRRSAATPSRGNASISRSRAPAGRSFGLRSGASRPIQRSSAAPLRRSAHSSTRRP